MPDQEFGIKITADIDDFAAKTRKLTQEINRIAETRAAKAKEKTDQRTEQRLVHLRQEQARLARVERTAAFGRLPVEQQIERLAARRIQLEQRITSAQAKGNTMRLEALRLARAQVDQQLRLTQATGRTAAGPAAGVSLGGLASRLGLAGLGTLAIFKARQKAREILATASATMDAAPRFGTDVETVQTLQHAGGKTGFGDEELAGSFRRMRTAQTAAIRGSEDHQRAFARFNVTVDELRKLKPEELFMRLAREAGPGGRATASLADATKILGSNADKAMGAFAQGFARLADEAKKAGVIIDRDVIEQLDDSAKKFQVFGAQMAVAFAPVVAVLSQIVLKMGEWFSLATKTGPVAKAAAYWGARAGGASPTEASRIADKQVSEQAAQFDANKTGATAEKEQKRQAVESKEHEIAYVKGEIATEAEDGRRQVLEDVLASLQNDLEVLKTGRDAIREEKAEAERIRAETKKLEAEAAFDLMTKEERLAELAVQRLEVEKKIQQTRDEIVKAAAEQELVKIDIQARRLQAKGEDDLRESSQPRTRADSTGYLARIGGRRDDVSTGKQLSVLENMNRRLAAIEEHTRRAGRNTEGLL